jgi:hypothetical protein
MARPLTIVPSTRTVARDHGVIPRQAVDFQYRLIGTETRNISRRDYTGLRFSEIEGKGRNSVLWRGCEAVVHSKAPISESPPYAGSDVFLRNCENVMLPLSDDQIMTMILKVISFDRGLVATL